MSAALVWWSFRGTEWSVLWQSVRNVRVVPLLVAIVLATLPFPLRVPRWRSLLRRADGAALPWQPLWHSIAIGFAANNVLPFRAGEVLRMAAISRLTGVPFASALSSVAVERVIDALVVIAMMGVGLVTADIPAGLTLPGSSLPISTLAIRTGVICLGVLLFALVGALFPTFALRVTRAVLPRNRIGQGLFHFAERVLLGLGALRDPRRAIPVIGWSLLVWGTSGLAFYAAFVAFGFDLPVAGAFILQGVLMVGIAVPSTPGYAGVFEAAIWTTLFALFGVPKEAGLAYALTYHITTFIPITLMGAWSAMQSGVHLSDARVRDAP